MPSVAGLCDWVVITTVASVAGLFDWVVIATATSPAGICDWVVITTAASPAGICDWVVITTAASPAGFCDWVVITTVPGHSWPVFWQGKFCTRVDFGAVRLTGFSGCSRRVFADRRLSARLRRWAGGCCDAFGFGSGNRFGPGKTGVRATQEARNVRVIYNVCHAQLGFVRSLMRLFCLVWLAW